MSRKHGNTKKNMKRMSTFGAIKNKVIFVSVGFLVVAIGALLIIRFSKPENTWICTQNGWEKHGNPSTEMPKAECEVITKSE